ncbi:hypothetical protein SDC9_67102 [bioreactor metagenome]|uniref:Uncharacterized protein n=1 Tax=bioreactor metagenome TaxID=1076179 RepID=A0A644XWP0_9ZZZZ
MYGSESNQLRIIRPQSRGRTEFVSSALFLSAARLAEQLFLVCWGVNHEIVPLVAAFVEADAPLGKADEIVLGFFELERIHIKLLVDVAGVEQEGVGRDAEQRLCQLGYAGDGEVLEVLAGEDDAGFFFANTLHEITDVLDCGQVRQEQIQLVDAGGGVALGQQLIRHERQHVEQQGVLHIFTGLQKSLYAEHHETAGCHIGMTVEKLALRALTHGVEPQQDVLKQFRCVELELLRVVGFIFRLDQLIEIGENGIVLRRQL